MELATTGQRDTQHCVTVQGTSNARDLRPNHVADEGADDVSQGNPLREIGTPPVARSVLRARER